VIPLKITTRQWDAFFEVLETLATSDDGSWGERKQLLLDEASRRDCEGHLDEVASWFGEDSD